MSRELFTPHSRGKVTRALREPGMVWTGERSGVHLRIEQSAQPDLAGARIRYRARWNNGIAQGTTDSVFDACALIQSAVDRSRRNEE